MAGKLDSDGKMPFMRKIIFSMMLAVTIFSCHSPKMLSNNSVVEKDHSKNLYGTWELQMLFASDNNWSVAPFVNINEKEKIFTGNSGCNNISGKFTIDASYISFDKNIISAKMTCRDNYEKAFLSVLLKVNKYTVTNNELELGQGEIVLMRFKRR